MNRFPDNLTPNMVEGINSFNLCVFLMGLEGWRRGLELTFYHDMNEYTEMRTQRKSRFGRSYSLKSKDKIHYFYQSRGDKVSNKAVKIAQSKQLTKEYLKKDKVSTLPSIQFTSSHTNNDIISQVDEIGFPLIIKPTYGTLSKGVILNIKNKNELALALEEVRVKMGYKNIIVERYFDGDDIRLYVVKNKVVAAIRRVPAKVKGDGQKTIQELIEIKNDSRITNPYLNARRIKINQETRTILQKQGYELNSVLEENITILVKNKSTMSQGVDLFDITDTITKNVKEMAVNTIHSLPNMEHGSVDMLFDGKQAYVIEVNASANISLHMFPTEGKPRNVMGAIIDYYFPETIGKAELHKNMYFDYLDIVKVLKKNYTNFIKLRTLGQQQIVANKYIISGDIDYNKYAARVLKYATDHELYGSIQKQDSNNIKVIIASKDVRRIEDSLNILKKNSKNIIIHDVEASEWQEEINNGFLVF